MTTRPISAMNRRAASVRHALGTFLTCAALSMAAAPSAHAQCDPVAGGEIAALDGGAVSTTGAAQICGRSGEFTILSLSSGGLGTSIFGGGGQSGGSTGGSCTPLGCLVQIPGNQSCSYGYVWEKASDGGPFTEYIPFSGTSELAPRDVTGFSSGFHVVQYRRLMVSNSGAPAVPSNIVSILQYAAYGGGIVAFNPGPQTSDNDLTITCGGVAPAIGEDQPALFSVQSGVPNAMPLPAFEHKWQAFYGGAWRDIHYTVNGVFFPQGRPDLDASLVNSELNAHAELVGQEYVLNFRRLARPVGRCDFVPAQLDVTLRRPVSSPIVTNNADVGPGSLRQAVTNACDEDIVTFSPLLGGSTITLSAPITISRNLTIKGDGTNRITISGNGTTRVFVVQAGRNATLSSLDIAGVRVPSSSGAIFNQGNLSVRDMTFRDGQGGVNSFPGSTLRVLDSAFHGNDTLPPDFNVRYGGGGISAVGTVAQPTSVEVINSTFSGNHSGGGAIYCQGCDLSLRNSTLTNNLADGVGGGLITGTDGSGKASSVALSGTIIAGNTATQGFGPDVYSYGATWTSGGHNLIGNNTDAFDFHPAGTDRFGTSVAPLAPKLVPLASNGGFTRTHALACASPAFDAGSPADGSADQIGQTPFGSSRDIGAFESQIPLEQASSAFRYQLDPADPLKVRFTDLSKGGPTAWSWSYSDDLGVLVSNSTDRHPVQTFLAPGRYIACLGASNACGATAAQCDPEVLSNDVPVPIVDLQTTSSKIVIDSLASVGDLRVRVDVKHTWRGDVRLTLVSPSGTRVVLKQTSGDAADDIVGTYGADLVPAQPLTTFEGEPASGTWRLEAFDAFSGDTGRIAAWGLEICEARSCLRADAADVPQNVVFGTPGTSVVNLPGGPPIDRLRVGVDVSAFHVANGTPTAVTVLKLELQSPSGTRITLADGNTPLSTTRLVGTYGVDLAPLQSLQAFAGESPAGTWQLIVSTRPFFPAHGGRINAFRVQACAAGDTVKCRPVTICGPGFVNDGAGNCVDFDECAPLFNACAPGLSCVNQQGSFQCAACPDDDGDGACNAADNCPNAANADQTDAGGLGSGSAPDGIGDACQCGDVSGDGRVTLGDAVIVQRSLLQPPTAVPVRPGLCDVNASASCSLADAVVIRRALLSPPTATIAQQCGAATP